MKITRIDTHLTELANRSIPYVVVHTDEGIHGVGEPFSCGPDGATVAAIHDFAEWLTGRDPRDIEGLYHLMYAGGRFPGGSVVNAAISGIEHALWDIAGKAAGLPVYRLVGGKARNRVRVYQSIGGETPQEAADDAIRLIQTYGYTALKMGPLPSGWHQMPWNRALRETERRVAAVREAVGPDIDIGLDPHARILEIGRAAQLCEVVAPFRPFFVEEPLRPENYEALAKLSNKVNVPIATGEMLYSRHEFRELLSHHAVDIIQPDICITGGLWEMKKIASMAEVHYASVAPHNPCGPVATAVNVHFAASTSNFMILEYKADDGRRAEIVDEPIKLMDGYLELPDRPGLGIDLNLDALAAHPGRSWHRPFLIRPDGSLAYQ
ncbi:MAG: galactonate dehydratase [Caldilineaceae bacterium]|nr:galactonate dehydratase [Caldilineaceae bacterium]